MKDYQYLQQRYMVNTYVNRQLTLVKGEGVFLFNERGEKYKKPFEPLLWEFVSIPFNTIEALEHVLTSDTAAFIVEPIQGEGGIFVPNSTYLQQVKEICSKHNILLTIDEIQTGNGRTG